MLRVGGEKAQLRELVDGSVLEQTKIEICDAAARNDLYVHLSALSGIGRLLIRLWFCKPFWVLGPEHP